MGDELNCPAPQVSGYPAGICAQARPCPLGNGPAASRLNKMPIAGLSSLSAYRYISIWAERATFPESWEAKPINPSLLGEGKWHFGGNCNVSNDFSPAPFNHLKWSS